MSSQCQVPNGIGDSEHLNGRSPALHISAKRWRMPSPTDQTAVVVADLACEYRSAPDRIVGGSDAFTKCPESIAVGLGRIRVFQTFLEGHHLAENPLP